MTTKLIVGANEAGIAAALELKRHGNEQDEVILISPIKEIAMTPTLNGMPIDWMEMDELIVPIEEVLTEAGIFFVEAEAICNDTERHLLLTTKGTFTYDEMVDVDQMMKPVNHKDTDAWQHDHLIQDQAKFFISMD
jgi:NADH dehydrogenase FAD-containing subunit